MYLSVQVLHACQIVSSCCAMIFSRSRRFLAIRLFVQTWPHHALRSKSWWYDNAHVDHGCAWEDLDDPGDGASETAMIGNISAQCVSWHACKQIFAAYQLPLEAARVTTKRSRAAPQDYHVWSLRPFHKYSLLNHDVKRRKILCVLFGFDFCPWKQRYSPLTIQINCCPRFPMLEKPKVMGNDLASPQMRPCISASFVFTASVSHPRLHTKWYESSRVGQCRIIMQMSKPESAPEGSDNELCSCLRQYTQTFTSDEQWYLTYRCDLGNQPPYWRAMSGLRTCIRNDE